MIVIDVCGGLGNQMFGYAFARARSIKENDGLLISKRLLKNDSLREYGLSHFALSERVKTIDSCKRIQVCHFFRYNLGKILSFLKIKIKNRHIYTVHNSLFLRNPDNIPYTKGKLNIYCGLFQNPDFFDQYRDVIVEDFRITDILNDEESIVLSKIKESDSVCVHIRRGDYVGNNLYNVCSVEYYKRAIEEMRKIKPDSRFFVFSDDIPWTKETFALENTIFVDCSRNEFIDLHLMMNCANFIISNSTFSWWAQYLSLNKDKVVIAPDLWLGDEKKMENALYQPNWICIDPF